MSAVLAQNLETLLIVWTGKLEQLSKSGTDVSAPVGLIGSLSVIADKKELISVQSATQLVEKTLAEAPQCWKHVLEGHPKR